MRASPTDAGTSGWESMGCGVGFFSEAVTGEGSVKWASEGPQ